MKKEITNYQGFRIHVREKRIEANARRKRKIIDCHSKIEYLLKEMESTKEDMARRDEEINALNEEWKKELDPQWLPLVECPQPLTEFEYFVIERHLMGGKSMASLEKIIGFHTHRISKVKRSAIRKLKANPKLTKAALQVKKWNEFEELFKTEK